MSADEVDAIIGEPDKGQPELPNILRSHLRMQIEKSTSNVYPYSEKPTDEADVDLTGGEVSNVTWSQGEREGEACVRSVQCDLSKIIARNYTHMLVQPRNEWTT